MIRFVGCMLIGLVTYAVVFLIALVWDFHWFKKFSRGDLVDLWRISVGTYD